MKKKKNFKEKIKESVFWKSEFYLKTSITFLFVVLFLLIFFFNNGLIYFEKYNYAYHFKGNPFQVHTIDVENGDAFLIRLPNQKTILIDTGDEKYYERVSSYIRQYKYYEKIKSIDYLILTHPDSDHIGNAAKIIENFDVKTLLRPKIYTRYELENDKILKDYKVSINEIYNQALISAYKNNCEILFNEKGIQFIEGDVKIEFLSPDKDEYSEDNNYSAVIMITYQAKKFLFTGDAESQIEKSLIENYGDYLRADVLKVGHHGSRTSTLQEFLDYVNPHYAILSSSGNSSVLPNNDVIDRLKKNNIEILATANLNSFAISLQNGDIVMKAAEKEKGNMEIILVIFLIIIFILWKIPFKDFKNNIFKSQNR